MLFLRLLTYFASIPCRIYGLTGYATYEIVYTDPSVTETAPIPVAVEFTGSPNARQVNVTPSFAPLDSTQKASATAPIPRFTGIYPATHAFAIQSPLAARFGISFTQMGGGAFRPIITGHGFPVALGDLAADASASAHERRY